MFWFFGLEVTNSIMFPPPALEGEVLTIGLPELVQIEVTDKWRQARFFRSPLLWVAGQFEESKICWTWVGLKRQFYELKK